MIMHPETSSQNARVRRSDMMKTAQNQRLARQLRHLSRARRAQRPQPHTGGARPLAARLRSILTAAP